MNDKIVVLPPSIYIFAYLRHPRELHANRGDRSSHDKISTDNPAHRISTDSKLNDPTFAEVILEQMALCSLTFYTTSYIHG